MVDAILGRGATVTVSLPYTGGVYVGSEVDYRGVQVGKVQPAVSEESGQVVIPPLFDDAAFTTPLASYPHAMMTYSYGKVLLAQNQEQ